MQPITRGRSFAGDTRTWRKQNERSHSSSDEKRRAFHPAKIASRAQECMKIRKHRVPGKLKLIEQAREKRIHYLIGDYRTLVNRTAQKFALDHGNEIPVIRKTVPCGQADETVGAGGCRVCVTPGKRFFRAHAVVVVHEIRAFPFEPECQVKFTVGGVPGM